MSSALWIFYMGGLSRFSTSLIPDLVLAEDFAACMELCLDGASND